MRIDKWISGIIIQYKIVGLPYVVGSPLKLKCVGIIPFIDIEKYNPSMISSPTII